MERRESYLDNEGWLGRERNLDKESELDREFERGSLDGSLYSKNMECRFLPGSWCSALSATLSPTDNVEARPCDKQHRHLAEAEKKSNKEPGNEVETTVEKYHAFDIHHRTDEPPRS
ncbi:hypothetical protein T05_1757 [Trichinella murrelli]|uniref:Uncharacterized protein n=1 Tax=Trichinella murrelli TaxID=144512 RepID=A0A0V0T4M5_9BILA|nr:hypothetical protein T05_1757 [Trichinella murrelli]